ncbi:MAG: RdgB/HAM1 family non-canonical purine NTP pyrophosphatase [Lachnospiraceae bacterium]|nr:RdgB/HAM1 family non-canonical purine NTP pyrophosphatase [Lachnospiraceae bacterium]
MRTILFATSNEGKLREIRMILQGLDVQVVSLREAGLSGVPIEEDGSTFEENAQIKVDTLRAYIEEQDIEELKDAIILADDSGLVVDYINGEPGIYSARYLGEDTSYDVKNSVIIERLASAKDDARSARFVCAIAAYLPATDGKQARRVTTFGIMEGRIAQKPAGSGGFGYDPILYLPAYEKTSAELTAEEKNAISHRGKALRAMKKIIEERWF